MCDSITTEQNRQIQQQPIQIQQPVQIQQQPVQEQQMEETHRLEMREPVEVPLLQEMEVHAEIEQPAPPLQRRESRSERKKREQLENARQKAAEQRAEVERQETGLAERRAALAAQQVMPEEQLRAEKALLEARLKAVALEEEAGLKEVEGGTPIQEMEVRHRAQVERARLAGEYARSLPLGSVRRKKAMAVKEKQELKANKLRRKLKVARMPEGEEKKREEATLTRHGHYDRLKKIFRKDNPLSHEDAAWTLPTGKTIVNVGRAFFGGTKPMYIFEDRSSPILRDGQVVGYKQYLFKEATNCIGMAKPEGALVTEAAAALQQEICGPYSIPAYAAIQDGKVLGSFQEKIETIGEEQRVDLFAWQTDPQDNIPADMKKEILREHTLDWLLCNFDTKGENFLHRTDGHLCSFDKEASFYKLMDPEAQHMSTEYKPHANDTLYNTLFTQFAQGNVTLDLSASLEQITKVESMYREEYLGLFSRMLEEKYGPAGPKNTARAAVEEAIWQRKNHLREEYRAFYTDLIRRRRQALGDDSDCAQYVDGQGVFRFADEQGQAPAPCALLQQGMQEERAMLVHSENIDRQFAITNGATTYSLRLDEQEAQRLKQASNGFLTYRKEANGVCVMRPSMPERVKFGEHEVEFRKNYKRLTRAVAGIAVTPEGKVRAGAVENIREISAAIAMQVGSADPTSDEIFLNIFLPVFQRDKALCGKQTPEQAVGELIEFLRVARGYNSKGTGSSASVSKISVFNTEAFDAIPNLIQLGEALDISPEAMQQRIAQLRQEDPTVTQEDGEKMMGEDLAAMRAEYQANLETMRRCATQDMDSEEVFLLGACSANGQLISCVNNAAGEGDPDTMPQERLHRHAFAHQIDDVLTEIPGQALERLSTVMGAPVTLDGVGAERNLQFMNLSKEYVTYTYHTAGHVGNIDGMMISLESFAAESYQMTGPGFTDQAGIGLFRDGEAFRKFYGRNQDAILNKDQVRRKKFKGSVLGKGM